MIGTYAKRRWAPDYPWAPTRGAARAFLDEIQRDVGRPGRPRGARAERRRTIRRSATGGATYLRMGASPGAALALTRMNADIDVRDVLPAIRVPTLVLHRTDDRLPDGRGGPLRRRPDPRRDASSSCPARITCRSSATRTRCSTPSSASSSRRPRCGRRRPRAGDDRDGVGGRRAGRRPTRTGVRHRRRGPRSSGTAAACSTAARRRGPGRLRRSGARHPLRRRRWSRRRRGADRLVRRRPAHRRVRVRSPARSAASPSTCRPTLAAPGRRRRGPRQPHRGRSRRGIGPRVRAARGPLPLAHERRPVRRVRRPRPGRLATGGDGR